jgi:hypothetical protein
LRLTTRVHLIITPERKCSIGFSSKGGMSGETFSSQMSNENELLQQFQVTGVFFHSEIFGDLNKS